jgi:hypothetical protein
MRGGEGVNDGLLQADDPAKIDWDNTPSASVAVSQYTIA